MGRIKELDGLRAIAALLVIAWHYVGIPDGPEFWLWKAFWFGHFGVDLFFVLSGFLITTILLENRNSSSYYSSFYGRRAFRIWPIYYLMVLICGIGWASGKSPFLFDGIVPGWTYLVGIQNFWMAKLQDYGVYWLGGTWSLAIEEQFYLVFPLVIRFVPARVLPKLLVFTIVACPIGRFFAAFSDDHFSYAVLPQFRADILCLGALVAWWRFNKKESEAVSLNVKRGLVVTSCLLPLIWVTGPSSFHSAAWQHTLVAAFLGCALFTVLKNQNAPHLSWLRSDIARHFANWSYASYMVHHWVAYLVFAALGVTRTMTTLAGVSTTALAFIITFGLCALSYRFFEGPLNRYAHQRFTFSGRKAPALSPAE